MDIRHRSQRARARARAFVHGDINSEKHHRPRGEERGDEPGRYIDPCDPLSRASFSAGTKHFQTSIPKSLLAAASHSLSLFVNVRECGEKKGRVAKSRRHLDRLR